MNRKIIITGATGLIGSHIIRKLLLKGFEITAFTRNKPDNKSRVSAINYIEWDFRKPESWQNYIDNSYGVIHLAGASIAGKRFTDSYKQKVLESRTISTENIVKAIESAKYKPSVFLCASGVNFYGDKGNISLTEDVPAGNDFLSNVCERWEEAAAKVESSGIRRVSIRTSPVLSTKGGILKPMLPLFKFYLGGAIGNGKQWFPWIHIDDIVEIYIYALENKAVSGIINGASPDYVTMKQFTEKLGKALNRPSFFKVPKFILKAAVGEAADFITASMKVVPQKLVELGFQFKYPKLEGALDDLFKNNK